MAGRGNPKGVGRPKGAKNQRTAEIEEGARASGKLPLEYMLDVMRDPNTDAARRDDMAKAAAPYLHARLASVSHTGKDGGPIQTEDLTGMSLQEKAQRLARILHGGATPAKEPNTGDSDGNVPGAEPGREGEG